LTYFTKSLHWKQKWSW